MNIAKATDTTKAMKWLRLPHPALALLLLLLVVVVGAGGEGGADEGADGGVSSAGGFDALRSWHGEYTQHSPALHRLMHGIGHGGGGAPLSAPLSTPHVVVATYHHTGHTTPLMALAKHLRLLGYRVSLATLDLARDQVQAPMEAVGVEFISAGSTPWSRAEDHVMTAEIFESKNFLNTMPLMKRMFKEYENNHFVGLEQHFAANRSLPDFMVVDVINNGGADFAVKHHIPFAVVQTAGFPLMDQVHSFFLPMPSHHAVFLFPRERLSKSWERVGNFYLGRVLLHLFGSAMRGTMREVRAVHGIAPGPTSVRQHFLPPPLIVCTTWGVGLPQWLPPYVMPVGALYDPDISPSDPLAPHLAEWLDSAARDGIPAVYISTGTNVRFLPGQLQTMVDATEDAPYRFVWSLKSEKYEHVPAMPPNVLVQDFVSQKEVLAHPALRAFVSHCGQNSMLEAIASEVPLLGIGFMGDQPMNAARMDDAGAGIALDRNVMTAEHIVEALRALIEDPSYKRGMERMHELLELGGGAARAAHLLDVGMRHGFRHLYPLDLFAPWYQYYDLDIYAANLILILILLAPAYTIFTRCCRRSQPPSSTAIKSKTA
eukprot:TRINITY_DN1738_c3_g1_i3.p1 TRINITY_DN1738_c3_g1~~TRINITY_DN1738_c3_g1_i3.p1  ORF type:complete len:600 (+),score=192.62 TRINITY_DN1738_c3_g1_i3:148-1947(+)